MSASDTPRTDALVDMYDPPPGSIDPRKLERVPAWLSRELERDLAAANKRIATWVEANASWMHDHPLVKEMVWGDSLLEKFPAVLRDALAAANARAEEQRRDADESREEAVRSIKARKAAERERDDLRERLRQYLEADERHRTCRSTAARRPILYTDTIGGEEAHADNLWAVTTEELNALEARAEGQRQRAECAERERDALEQVRQILSARVESEHGERLAREGDCYVLHSALVDARQPIDLARANKLREQISKSLAEGSAAIVECRLLRAEVERMRALLRKCEWSNPREPNNYYRRCPECGREQRFGHGTECALRAALGEG